MPIPSGFIVFYQLPFYAYTFSAATQKEREHTSKKKKSCALLIVGNQIILDILAAKLST